MKVYCLILTCHSHLTSSYTTFPRIHLQDSGNVHVRYGLYHWPYGAVYSVAIHFDPIY
jgi:hypothetical protein